jgi:hypothetical protein
MSAWTSVSTTFTYMHCHRLNTGIPSISNFTICRSQPIKIGSRSAGAVALAENAYLVVFLPHPRIWLILHLASSIHSCYSDSVLCWLFSKKWCSKKFCCSLGSPCSCNFDGMHMGNSAGTTHPFSAPGPDGQCPKLAAVRKYARQGGLRCHSVA